MPVATTILLYEDNAGNLFLYPDTSDTVYQIVPEPDQDFDSVCRDIDKGLVNDWSNEWVLPYAKIVPLLDHPETQIIAAWHSDKPWERRGRAGHAGAQFLNVDASLRAALKESGTAEAEWDRYTIVVREDEDEEFNDVLTMTIQVAGMPPFFTQDYTDITQVEAAIHESSAPEHLEWNAVKEEGI